MNGRRRTKMLMHISTTLVLADANKYDIFFISLTDTNKFPPIGAEKPKNSLQLALNLFPPKILRRRNIAKP
jgi:hypothetical protein